MIVRIGDWFVADVWRAVVVVLALAAGGKGAWDFYWWNQWLKQVSYQQQQVIKFLAEPAGKTPDGKVFNRADLLNLLAQQVSQPSQSPQSK